MQQTAAEIRSTAVVVVVLRARNIEELVPDFPSFLEKKKNGGIIRGKSGNINIS